MMKSLEGQTILITGAAVRIGRSLALCAAQQGANIIIHYGNSRMEAESTLSEVEQMGVKGMLIQADLNNLDQVKTIIPSALQFGPIDAVINSASVFESLEWFDTSIEDWNRHMNINLTAPFLISQGFAHTLSPNSSSFRAGAPAISEISCIRLKSSKQNPLRAFVLEKSHRCSAL